MFVTSFEASFNALTATPDLSRNVQEFVARTMFVSVSLVVIDSESPGFEAVSFQIRDDCGLVVVAKDRNTLLSGMARNQSPITLKIRKGDPPRWYAYTGSYGGVSAQLIGSKFNKLRAGIMGHSLYSRGALRTELERNNLKQRGYFVVVTPAAILPERDRSYKRVDFGVVMGLPLSTIGNVVARQT